MADTLGLYDPRYLPDGTRAESNSAVVLVSYIGAHRDDGGETADRLSYWTDSDALAFLAAIRDTLGDVVDPIDAPHWPVWIYTVERDHDTQAWRSDSLILKDGTRQDERREATT